jgi:anti-anti-sigma regulatory factor
LWAVSVPRTFVDREPAGSFTAAFKMQKHERRGWLTLHHGTRQMPCEGLLTGPQEGDMDTSFAIMIKLPESLGSREAKKMVRELKIQITKEPPCVLLDLSLVKQMDSAGLHGLLVCLQEIARYDCAVQLRAISPEAATLLELVRMDRLLQKFPPLPAQAPSFTVVAVPIAEELTSERVVQLQPVAA